MGTWKVSLVAIGWVACVGSLGRAEDAIPLQDDPAPGTRVRVRLADDAARTLSVRRVTGRIVASEPDTLELMDDSRPPRRFKVPRASIERLDVSRGQSKRGKTALKGAGIGFVMGGAATLAIRATCEGWDCITVAPMAAVVTPALTVAFAGLGAIMGEERWEPVPADRRTRVTLAPTLGRGVGARLAVSF